MSAFDALFAASAAGVLVEQFGQADGVVYVAPDGTRTLVSAIVGELSAEEMSAYSLHSLHSSPAGAAREVERIRKFDLPRSAAIAAAAGGSAAFVAAPRTTATILHGGTTWAIRQVLAQTEAFSTVLAVEVAAADRARPGYRR